MSMTEDFFRNRLDQLIDLRHPLAVLANRMPWQEIEASLAHRFARQVRSGKKIEDMDMFGATQIVAGAGVSNASRPRLPTRLMVSLLYLKHAFNESDEDVVQRWGETPTWQYFSGQEYFEHRLPCDPTLLVKFRKLLGEEGVEELLARTIEVEVDPISRTPYCSYRRSPRCPIQNRLTRRNFESRWSSWFELAANLASWPKNLAVTPPASLAGCAWLALPMALRQPNRPRSVPMSATN